ncbi:glycosyltransferase family 4 protein [Tenuifilum thalassicum]|uniref:Glycosyltransferase family 4 protein n=1 Tax=Tenuifilum thalassicum TaxID=2590900 RepID=A0A7D3XL38_9BACT|nr:glycosyltransferase family 4 protein [Tenuifilum thalassicum]QKG80075.1 glycosyltransferase family 4 protein [Tenuifilum thalassicum]
MNILMLLDNEFPPDVRVESEANSLIKQGHSVTILSYNFSNKPLTEEYKGIQIVRFNINKQVAKKALGFIMQLPFYKLIWRFQINKLLKVQQFDAIHIHDLPLCINARYIKEKFSLKVVADLHENYPHLITAQPFMNSLFATLFLSKKKWFQKEKEWLMNVTEIVCVANEMKERIDLLLDHKKSIHVVPNTINFETYLSIQKPIPELKNKYANNFVVMYIGGFNALRGLKYLIQAASLLKDKISNLKVILVGDGNSMNNLTKLANDLNLSNYIIFEGWQPSNKVKAYIDIADVCVIPHVKSTQADNSSPNKLFQYMYSKKPVISSNCKSIEKIIIQEDCGLIFENKNYQDLANKILKLYEEPKLKKQLGENGYEAVINKYNWDTTVNELLNIYSN